MTVFVDIGYLFLREPIKLALIRAIPDIEFTNLEDSANLVIGTVESYTTYSKPTIYLTDHPDNIQIDVAYDISPVPSNHADMEVLIQKTRRFNESGTW